MTILNVINLYILWKECITKYCKKIYSREENDRNVKYSFNTVTDEDVAKPNVNEYEYKAVESN